MCLLFYLAIAMPVQLSFDIEAPMSVNIFEAAIDTFFLLDIVLNFRTGFLDDEGHAVMRNGPIAKEYCRRDLWIDLVASVPLTLSTIVGGRQMSRGVQYFTLLRFMRFFKLIKFLKINSFFKSIEEAALNIIVALPIITKLWATVKLLGNGFLLLHYIACSWWFIGGEVIDSSTVSWKNGDNTEGLVDEHWADQYVCCLYWAVSVCGVRCVRCVV